MKERIKHIAQLAFSLLQRAIRWFLAHWDRIAVGILTLCLLVGAYWYRSRRISPQEQAVRNHIVRVAESYLGYREADGSHQEIVDLYNSHVPRARGYEVTYEDSWCATFTSAVALQSYLVGWIPMECSCEQQILLFNSQGDWLEKDCYLPRPGDYIYYDWNSQGHGDCTGWSDHVGIVVSTFGPVIKVIEGNKDDDVSYRYIFVNDPSIRGFGLPRYGDIE